MSPAFLRRRLDVVDGPFAVLLDLLSQCPGSSSPEERLRVVYISTSDVAKCGGTRGSPGCRSGFEAQGEEPLCGVPRVRHTETRKDTEEKRKGEEAIEKEG